MNREPSNFSMTNCEMTMLSNSDADDETKVVSNMSNFDIDCDTNFDPHQNYENHHIHQDYNNVVDCIVSCESIINTLQEQLASKDKNIASLEEKIVQMSPSKDEQLASKDERIAILEEKIVQMSLELASSKAFEDSHRGIRRISSVGDYKSSDYDNPRCSEPVTDAKNQHFVLRRATVDVTAPAPISRCTNDRTASGRRHRQQRRFSLGGREGGPALDDSATTKSTCPLDESSVSTSSRMSINFDFGQLFGKNRGNKLRDSTTSEETPEEGDTDDHDRQAQQRRRPPNRTRVHRLQSNLLSTEGVVFQSSFGEELNKACLTSSVKTVEL